MTYYIIYNGQVVGPMTLAQVTNYKIDANTQVSVDGVNWAPLFQYPELMQFVQPQANVKQTDSQRLTFGLLALLIGTLGIQYFIIGKTTAGILTILLSLITCGFWGILTFIQGIVVLTMSDETFLQKYVYSNSTLPLF